MIFHRFPSFPVIFHRFLIDFPSICSTNWWPAIRPWPRHPADLHSRGLAESSDAGRQGPGATGGGARGAGGLLRALRALCRWGGCMEDGWASSMGLYGDLMDYVRLYGWMDMDGMGMEIFGDFLELWEILGGWG